MAKPKFELNITMRCNLGCRNCNRLCNFYRDRTEDVPVEAISMFVQEARQAGGVGKVKVVGGEPLLHPQFPEIYAILADAAKHKIVEEVKVDTNQTIKPTVDTNRPNVRWMGRSLTRKKHIPYFWSPTDLGLPSSLGCDALRRCGASLDARGWLPCSASIMLVRLFGKEHLYRDTMPLKPWGLEEICPHCIFSAPKNWLKTVEKPPHKTTVADMWPTRTWIGYLLKNAPQIMDELDRMAEIEGFNLLVHSVKV